MKLLDIKPLGQRDPRWANQRLGTVDGTTIGSDGCVVTSHCMGLTFHGKPYLPNELDDFLTNNDLYSQGNLWVPTNISKVWDKMKFVRTIYCEEIPAPLGEITKAIDANQPSTLWLINEGVLHNILAIGYETVNGTTQIWANDPWRGDKIRLDQRWGDSAQTILFIDFYEGPVTNSPQPMDPTTQRKASWYDRFVIAREGTQDTNKRTDTQDQAFSDRMIREMKRAVEFDRDVVAAFGSGADSNATTSAQVVAKLKGTDLSAVKKKLIDLANSL